MSLSISSSLNSRLTVATPAAGRGAIISATGREGTGKSGFALSAASERPDVNGGCVYIPMDRKLKGDYIESLISSRKVLIPKTNFKHTLDKRVFSMDVAKKMWAELNELSSDILEDRGIRTLIWDTSSYAWGLLRMAEFGKLTQVMPHEYTRVNSTFETLFWKAEENNKIFICIDRMSKEYKAGRDGKDGWTGGFERSGYSHMNSVANIRLEHYRTKEVRNEAGDVVAAPQFGVRILQNKLQPASDGVELVGDECAFPYLALNTWVGADVEEFT